jgi:hypothetical protein
VGKKTALLQTLVEGWVVRFANVLFCAWALIFQSFVFMQQIFLFCLVFFACAQRLGV